jgi:hypothetical protein
MIWKSSYQDLAIYIILSSTSLIMAMVWLIRLKVINYKSNFKPFQTFAELQGKGGGGAMKGKDWGWG